MHVNVCLYVLYVYVYICICMYMCIFVCMYVYVYVYVNVYVGMFTYMYMYILCCLLSGQAGSFYFCVVVSQNINGGTAIHEIMKLNETYL